MKIADFGLARMVNAQTRVTLPAAVLGTPEYMSPEQARGESSDGPIDHRADLYAAGVVLYELLTGRTPFRADSSSVVLHRILHDEPADPRTLTEAADPHLAGLALRLMAKRPEDRFASAGDALAALEASGRVRRPERIRRVGRRIGITLMALALLSAGGWLAVRPFRHGAITGVTVDPGLPTRVLVTRHGETGSRPFHDFPLETARVRAALFVDLDGRGKQAVVAGLWEPGTEGCLDAYDAGGRQRPGWPLDLSAPWQWPDCGPRSAYRCYAMAKGNFDGQPGDELVVAASERDEYGTRVSIVDPRTGRIGPTFWHMGHVGQLEVGPDLLGPGRPGIVALASNNKLDGFDDPTYDVDPPLTEWDIVSVIMVLDPQAMEGLGPPKVRALPELKPVVPVAYAFLDCPTSAGTTEPAHARRERKQPTLNDAASVRSITLDAPFGGKGADLNIRMLISVPEGAEHRAPVLFLAPDLHLLGVKVGNEDYWRARWHVIIRDGRYVNSSGGPE